MSSVGDAGWPSYFRTESEFSYSVHNPLTKTVEFYPLPILSAEAASCSRPSSATCFSFHPYGVVKIYERACEAASSLSDVNLDQADHSILSRQIWQLSAVAFKPGEPLREGFDRIFRACGIAISGRSSLPSEDESRSDALRLLAAYLVASALRDTDG